VEAYLSDLVMRLDSMHQVGQLTLATSNWRQENHRKALLVKFSLHLVQAGSKAALSLCEVVMA